MKITNGLIIVFLIGTFSNCKSKPTHISQKHDKNSTTDAETLRTGFYSLADSVSGIRMRMDKSNEYFFVSKIPFASVDNVENVEYSVTKIGNDTFRILTLYFDDIGTKSLKQVTGNSSFPLIAAVVANKLLFVVENHSKIETGNMRLILNEYKEEEILDMKKAISEKK